MELETELARLKGLYEKGLIDEAEYREEKKALLAQARTGGITDAGRSAPRGADDTLLDFSTGMSLDAGDRKYRLEEKIGEGGMGVVWRALDEAESEVIGKPAYKAIKTLHLSAEDDPVGYKRIKEEAILASRLSHPNIVRVFDWREDRDNKSPFIVMEWLPGKNLGKVLAEEGKPGLPLERVLELLSPVAEALDYAWNEHRLVHRDIKPGNVILTADGKVKLLDFGIAVRVGSTKSKMVGYDGKEQARTERYSAPESKVKHAPQPQLDIYSLAVMAYELLEGEAPYDDSRSPHTPAPQKPEALNEAQWQVLKQAFAYEAGERMESVVEFLTALTDSEAAKRRRDEALWQRLVAANSDWTQFEGYKQYLEEAETDHRRDEASEKVKAVMDAIESYDPVLLQMQELIQTFDPKGWEQMCKENSALASIKISDKAKRDPIYLAMHEKLMQSKKKNGMY